ncbi:MAG: hypothetical protein ACKO85_16970 [Isosphaeraceae bacterium]
MYRLHLSSIVLSALVLSAAGCGGGGNTTGDAPPQSPAAQAANDAYVKSAGKDFMQGKTKGSSAAAKKPASAEAPR